MNHRYPTYTLRSTQSFGWLKFSRIVFFVVFFLTTFIPLHSSNAQDTDAGEKAAALLGKMTPEEKVGQLFLATFDGTNISEETQIYDLVVNHMVGGFVLRVDHNNFTSNTLPDASTLINGLQTLNWEQTQSGDLKKAYIPLFISLAQETDGSPTYQYIQGMDSIPNQLMTGATWSTQKAQDVGNALGALLSQLGINLFVGPSLDVLETPGEENGDDLGVKSFGGDPYWVGVLGKAYISGLHMGATIGFL